jgi:hypothetical protein
VAPQRPQGRLGRRYGQLYHFYTLRAVFPEGVLIRLTDHCVVSKGGNNLFLSGAMINDRLWLLAVSVSKEILSDPFSRRDLDDA